MNFYKHHLGDYAADTVHVSWDEDCAYRRLLDAYYKREAPIPADVKEACRLVRASTPAQRKAVEVVLREFFSLEVDGWHQKRCDVELSAAMSQAETNRRIAADRERRRARLKDESSDESLHEPSKRNGHEPPNDSLNDSSPFRAESVNLAISHKPDSRLQTPEKPRAPPDPQLAPAEPPANFAAGALSVAMRRKGVRTQPSEPRLMALAEAGVTPEQAEQACDAARETKGQNETIPPAYVYSILERWKREPGMAPPMPPEDVASAAIRLIEAERASH